MESQAVPTDPAILAKQDERPKDAFEPSSTQSSSPTDKNRYQRDEQFHLGLKQAASRRRQVSKNQENQSFVRHSQEAAIARALHAAATEYCLPNASEFDDSFFYAAIDLAMKGSKLPLNCNKGQDESRTKASDDLSLPDMLDALVNRSTRTIVQQKEEIYCLRLVVRELMQELLSAEGDGEASRTSTAQVSSPSTFESPRKKYDRTIMPIEETSSFMTPTTASTTIATPESFPTTPQRFQAGGSTYSSGANSRQLVSPKSSLSNNGLAASGSPTSSPMMAQLKDVQKSLDATMKETERNGEGFMTVGDGNGTSTLLDGRGQLPSSTSLSPHFDNNVLAIAPGANSLPKTPERSIDIAPLPSPDIGSARNASEQTQSAYVVECIIDAMIDKSLELVEASAGSLLPPDPRQRSLDIMTSDSDISNMKSRADMSAHDSAAMDFSDRPSVEKKAEDQLVGLGESTGSSLKAEALHIDPPARLTRIESRNFGDEVGLLSTLGEPDANLVSKRWPGNDLNESDTRKPHIFEDREQDDESETDPDASYSGERRMVVLISNAVTDPVQASHQEQSLAILRDNDVEVEFVDGADPASEEIRECLFVVSGISQVYPQFFMVDDDGMTEFLGNFDEVKQLHDNGELRSAILGISPASGTRHEEQASVGHQEEKKDEQAANPMSGDHPMALSTRSWDQGAQSNGGQNRDIATPLNGGQSSSVAGTMETNDLPIFIREEGFSWMDPSPFHTGQDPPSSGRLAVIKEDPTGVNESFLSTISSDLNSSNEVFEEGSRRLRWV